MRLVTDGMQGVRGSSPLSSTSVSAGQRDVTASADVAGLTTLQQESAQIWHHWLMGQFRCSSA
jgi:hypothetical protein